MKYKKIQKSYINIIIDIIVIISITFTCIPLPVFAQASKPVVTTVDADDITENSAKLYGKVDGNGGSGVIDYGFCFGTNSNPTYINSVGGSTSTPKSYSRAYTNLQPGTTYYYRAYATNSIGTSYGSTMNFTTQSVPEESTYSIKGKVKDSNGNGISDALVYIGDQYDYTSSSGSFTVKDVTSGNHNVSVSKDGYTTYTTSINVSDNMSGQNYTLRTIISTYNVGGIVKDSTGNMISGALVYIGDQYTYSASDGSFTVNNVASGSHALSATKDGYQDVTGTLPVTGNISNIKITMKPNTYYYTVSGTVRDNNGNSLSQALVYIGDKYAYTNSSGSYTVKDITSGDHNVSISKDGYTTYTTSINVSDNVNGQNFTLTATISTYNVGGTVKDSAGNMISGALVYIGDQYTYSASDGSFSVSNVTSGEHAVSAKRDGYQDVTGKITVTGNISNIKITMKPNTYYYTVSGTVRDNNGNSLSQALVYIGDKYAYTNSSGSYTVKDVTSGDHNVSISKDGYTTYTTSVNVSDNVNGQNFTLTATISTYNVSGIVKDSAGNMISGALVYIGDQYTYSAADGSFSVSNVTSGEHAVNATREGYQTTTGTINVTGNTSGIKITLKSSISTLTVSGTVRDNKGNSLSQALVYIGDKYAYTGSNGSFTVKDLTSGNHNVSVSKDGYTTYTTSLAVSNNMSGQNFTLTATISTYNVGGTVKDSAGNMISGALVYIGDQYTYSASDGSFSVSNVTSGEHAVSAKRDGYQDVTGKITVTGNTSSVKITMKPNTYYYTVSGTVRDNNGNSLSQALVYIGDKYAYTNSSGSYTVKDVTSGDHNVSISKDGYTTYTTSINVSDNMNGQNFTLSNGKYNISGTIRDSNGKTLSGALVYVGDKYAYSTAGGGYSVIDVKPGSYNISVSKDNYTKYTGSLTVTSNLTGIDFTLTSSISINIKSVTVTSSSGTNRAGDTYTFTVMVSGSPSSVSIYFDNPSSGNISNQASALTLSSNNYDGTKTYILSRQILTQGNMPSYIRNFQVKATDTQNESAIYNGTFVVNPPVTYTISGTVRDLDGKPITDALVKIGDISAYTDVNGYYSLLKVSAGNQTITVTKKGYSTQTTKIDVQYDISWQHFTLQVDNSILSIKSVTVTSSSGANRVGDTYIFKAVVTGSPTSVSVFFDNPSSGIISNQASALILSSSNYDGTKTYVLSRQISTPGSAPSYVRNLQVKATDATGSQTKDSTFTVNPPLTYTISGTVRDSEGRPIADATVKIGDLSSNTDLNGNYLLLKVSAGNQDITVTKIGYLAQTAKINVQSNISWQNFTLQIDNTILSIKSVTVTSSSGANHAGDTYTFTAIVTGSPTSVSIFFDNPSSGNMTNQASPLTLSSSNYDGTKTYILSRQISTSGSAPSFVRNLQVKATDATGSQTKDGTFTVNPPLTYTISGTVRDSDGRPIADATVKIGDLSSNTDLNGNYSLLKVYSGNQTTTVTKTGYKTQTVIINVNSNISWQNFTLQIDNTILSIKSVIAMSSSGANRAGDTYTFTAIVSGSPSVSIIFDNPSSGNLSNQALPLTLSSSNYDGTKTYVLSKQISTPGSAPSYIRNYQVKAIDATGSQTKDGTFTVNPPLTYTISGTVRDSDGRPITDATVKIGNISSNTDVNGNYSLLKVSTGSQEITVTKTGYLAQTVKINVQSNISWQNFTMQIDNTALLIKRVEVTSSSLNNQAGDLYTFKVVVTGSPTNVLIYFDNPSTGLISNQSNIMSLSSTNSDGSKTYILSRLISMPGSAPNFMRNFKVLVINSAGITDTYAGSALVKAAFNILNEITNFTGDTITLKSTASSEYEHVYYYLIDQNGKEYSIGTSYDSNNNWIIQFDPYKYYNGSNYTMAVVAKDSQGNQIYGESISNIKIDTPKLKIALQSNSNNIMGNILVKSYAKPDIHHIYYYLSSTDNVEYPIKVVYNSSDQWAVSYDTTLLSNGTYTLLAACVDYANNRFVCSNQYTITINNPFQVDSVSPLIVKYDNPNNIVTIYGSGFILNNDNVKANMITVESANSIVQITNLKSVSANQITFVIPDNLQDGSYKIYVRNSSGNVVYKTNAFEINTNKRINCTTYNAVDGFITIRIGQITTLFLEEMVNGGWHKTEKSDDIKWTSSNSSIVTIDNDGYLLAKQGGCVVITANYQGNKVTAKLEVKNTIEYGVPVDGIGIVSVQFTSPSITDFYELSNIITEYLGDRLGYLRKAKLPILNFNVLDSNGNNVTSSISQKALDNLSLQLFASSEGSNWDRILHGSLSSYFDMEHPETDLLTRYKDLSKDFANVIQNNNQGFGVRKYECAISKLLNSEGVKTLTKASTITSLNGYLQPIITSKDFFDKSWDYIVEYAKFDIANWPEPGTFDYNLNVTVVRLMEKISWISTVNKYAGGVLNALDWGSLTLEQVTRIISLFEANEQLMQALNEVANDSDDPDFKTAVQNTCSNFYTNLLNALKQVQVDVTAKTVEVFVDKVLGRRLWPIVALNLSMYFTGIDADIEYGILGVYLSRIEKLCLSRFEKERYNLTTESACMSIKGLSKLILAIRAQQGDCVINLKEKVWSKYTYVSPSEGEYWYKYVEDAKRYMQNVDSPEYVAQIHK